MALVFQNGSATISGTEFFLISNSATQTPQTDDAVMQVLVDFAAMAAGDRYQVTIYEKVNGGTQRAIYQSVVDGAQAFAWVSPSLIVGEGYDVGIKKLAGTNRAIAWSVRKAQ